MLDWHSCQMCYPLEIKYYYYYYYYYKETLTQFYTEHIITGELIARNWFPITILHVFAGVKA